jgi:hypothetical protein
MLRGRLLLGFLMTGDSSASSSLDGYTAEGVVLAQPGAGPCSQAAMWSMSAFLLGIPAAFLRVRHTGNLTHHTA